jgi:large subunit ribosomal protein L6e
MSTEAQTKKFQKGERVIPSATDKALKYYPAEDEQVMKKVRMRPPDIEPGIQDAHTC